MINQGVRNIKILCFGYEINLVSKTNRKTFLGAQMQYVEIRFVLSIPRIDMHGD